MIPFDNFNNEEKMERAQLYRLFAALLMEEPSIEILTELSDIFQVDINETLDEIEKDFAYLFSAPGKHLLPYESIYTGKVAGEVQAFYSSTGLIIDEERNLAADHLSTELSFMSYLIENGLAEYQSFFLKNHLITWIPRFCDDMNEHAQTSFYKDAANLLKEFILSEQNNYESS